MKRAAESQITTENPEGESVSGGTAERSEAENDNTKVQVVSSSEDFWRVQVEAVYRRRNPQKLAGVADLLEKYKGKEVVLYSKVCKTYDLDPKQFYADPKAWEKYERDTAEDDGVPADSGSSGLGLGGLGSIFGSSGSGTESGAGGAVTIPNLFGLSKEPSSGSGSIFGSSSSGSIFGSSSSGSIFGTNSSGSLFEPSRGGSLFGSSSGSSILGSSSSGASGTESGSGASAPPLFSSMPSLFQQAGTTPRAKAAAAGDDSDSDSDKSEAVPAPKKGEECKTQ